MVKHIIFGVLWNWDYAFEKQWGSIKYVVKILSLVQVISVHPSMKVNRQSSTLAGAVC